MSLRPVSTLASISIPDCKRWFLPQSWQEMHNRRAQTCFHGAQFRLAQVKTVGKESSLRLSHAGDEASHDLLSDSNALS